MKIYIQYLFFLGIGIALFLSLIGASKNPETTIVGSWSELEWKYEKVDKNDTLKKDFDTISNYVKEVVGQNLILPRFLICLDKPQTEKFNSNQMVLEMWLVGTN